MEEYLNYIKWLGRGMYTKEIEQLNNPDVGLAFYDNVDYNILKDDMIFILDCSSIKETIYKIYKYKNKIDNDFKVLDISVFKGNDKVYFHETYLVSMYCVDYSKYESDKELYNSVFELNKQHMDLFYNSSKKIIENEEKYIVDINNIPQNENHESLNNIFSGILKCTIQDSESKLNLFNTHGEASEESRKMIKDRLLENFDVKYIDKILEIKSNKKIKRCRVLDPNIQYIKIKNVIDGIFDNNYKGVAIVDFNDDTVNNRYIDLLKCLNIKSIVLSKNKKSYDSEVIVVSDLNSILEELRDSYILYISNRKNTIDISNVINIKIKDTDEVNEQILLDKILENKKSIYVFSGLDHKNSVKVLASTFLDFDGKNYYSGGAERYLIDLHKVCKDLGLKLRIYQKANFNFFRYYNDMEVVGISNNKEDYNYEYEQNKGILKEYNSIARSKTLLNIYSSFMECIGEAIKPSIGISHGVAWDAKDNEYVDKNLNDKTWIVDAAISCDKVVSVDTNTANYFQTIDFKLGNTMEVIPNYVNIKEFSAKKLRKRNSNIIIVYPRRLYAARGMYLLVDILDKLLSKYKNVEVHFVGKGFKSDTDKIQEKIDKWGNNRIKMYSCAPEKMHEVYKKADISVIPTLYSEGTSLSCLEAMASKNAVIATRVGGLSDLVINNYNGKLIEPNSESLYDAIEEFINNKALMKKCKKNAREVARSFNKKIWIERWKKLILSQIKQNIDNEIVEYKIAMVYVSDKNIENLKFIEFLYKKLVNNYLVYVVNDNYDRKKSYGRIQYISENEELYRAPDIVVIDKDYNNINMICGEYVEF